MTDKKSFVVKQLTRVEGDGGLSVRIKAGRVTEVKFNITEPPRLFEAFLRGRHCTEVPDLTARICGICPLAYALSSGMAMENAFGLAIDPRAYNLRRLIFLGEWIASHSLHIHLLHAPDFFGCADAIELSAAHPEAFKRGLRLKQIGNAIVRCVGGREVHPVNLRIGGFYRYPSRSELLALRADLQWALGAARETIQWTAGFTFPDFTGDYVFLALHHPDRYALLEGRLRFNTGADLAINAFEDFMEEEQVDHSTALQVRSRDKGAYLVGPLARFNLNFDQLSPAVRAAALSVGLRPVCANPFKSIVVRSVEILQACEESLNLVESYEAADPTEAIITPIAASGFGCTEAPRGLCWHRYRLDESGHVLDARIVPPTAQNLKVIEGDLQALAENYQDLPLDQLKWKCEQLVRSYDPCISCSCHLLNLG
jgi:sulfhydrogenase subunit alpha